MNPPTDLRNRAFAALCDDLTEGKGFHRLDALRAIQREAAQQGRGGSNVAAGNQ